MPGSLATRRAQGFALHQAGRARPTDPGCPAILGAFLVTGATMPYLQHIGPVTALIAGVLILIMPRLLNYIIALYLIVTGLVGLFGR
jgi:hypothetical protein